MKIAESKVTYIDHCGSDLNIVNAARVSFKKESDWELGDFINEDGGYYPKVLSDKDAKLIRYLAKHKHFSPFNHTFISVRVKAPIFVARQLVKHEYMPWNEISRRYVDEEPEFYMPDVWRAKADNVKQGSSNNAVEDNVSKVLDSFSRSSTQSALNTYNFMLENNVCAEQARMVLPQNTMTEWIWSGTLKAFAKMLQLRLDPHTQQETREIAVDVKSVIMPLFPISLPALLESEL